MTAYEDDTAILAGLLMERPDCTGASKIKNKTVITMSGEKTARDMALVVDHLRAVIIAQAEDLRQWRCRHEMINSPLQRKFSALEGVFARHALRLHWLLYRRAVRMMLQDKTHPHRRPRRWAVKK